MSLREFTNVSIVVNRSYVAHRVCLPAPRQQIRRPAGIILMYLNATHVQEIPKPKRLALTPIELR